MRYSKKFAVLIFLTVIITSGVNITFTFAQNYDHVSARFLYFTRGDTVSFDVESIFPKVGSYIEIYDPAGDLYWQTETFGWWVKVGDVYTVPYYLQTSGMNPMTLSQDAPMGTWFWVFYESGTDQLVNGTFEVGPSSAAQVDARTLPVADANGPYSGTEGQSRARKRNDSLFALARNL